MGARTRLAALIGCLPALLGVACASKAPAPDAPQVTESNPSQGDPMTPEPEAAPDDPMTTDPEAVQTLVIRLGDQIERAGLVLALNEGRRITRGDGSGFVVCSLVVNGAGTLEGDTGSFVDEAVVAGKLVTVFGWKSEGALDLRVGPAPSPPALDEDEAGALAAKEAQRLGFDVEQFDESYWLTRGEGAVIYTLEEDERVRLRLIVGLYSRSVLSTQRK